MNIEKARQGLSDGLYSKLPRYQKTNRKGKFFKDFGLILKDLTIVLPVLELIFKLSIESPVRNTYKPNLKPHMLKRLAKKEMQIQQIAKNAGIRDWKRFKAVIGNSFVSEAALYRSTIILPPDDLIKPKDLPPSLKLERLDKGEITKTDWIIQFAKWFPEEYCKEPKKVFISQFGVDKRILSSLRFLNSLQRPELRQKNYQALIGHELGHCELRHTFKYEAVAFALQLLAWPTLGLYRLFYAKTLEKLSRSHEKQADLFCAKRVGKGQDLANEYKAYLKLMKHLHPLYPERYDPKGNDLTDVLHPPLSERVKHLSLF